MYCRSHVHIRHDGLISASREDWAAWAAFAARGYHRAGWSMAAAMDRFHRVMQPPDSAAPIIRRAFRGEWGA